MTLSAHPDDEIFVSVTLPPFYAARIDGSVTLGLREGSQVLRFGDCFIAMKHEIAVSVTLSAVQSVALSFR